MSSEEQDLFGPPQPPQGVGLINWSYDASRESFDEVVSPDRI
jgi:hypothetical protein